uniref:hypothetical protein n=1 Tax=Riemerella anatipestifer TaxID=34085 RepID=UPI0030BC1504
AIVSPTGPPPIIATFLSLSKFICLSVSIRIVIQKWHITGRVLPKAGTSQHLTSTKIPYYKDKQNFLKCKYPPLAAIPCCNQFLFSLSLYLTLNPIVQTV